MAKNLPKSWEQSARPTVRPLIACVLFGCSFLAIGMTDSPDPAPEPASASDPGNETSTGHDEEGLHECVVTLNTGRSITGFLIESRDDDIVLRLEGIDTTYQRRNIANISFLAPISQRYADIRSTIDDTDIETRLVLVEWLRTRQAYTLALNELRSILETAPNNGHAKTLHDWLKAHLELASKSGTPKESTQRPQKRNPTKAPGVPTLTEDQINLMRVYELDLSNPPKMIVPDATITTLMQRFPDDFPIEEDARKAYFSLSDPEKLRLLFQYRARDLYHTVKVLEDPESVKLFKSTVNARNGWLVNACASTRCHGGADAGKFRLIGSRPNTDASAYTNLYILDHFVLEDGTPMIDYENPARSPLLQLATQPVNSLRPHPEIAPDYPGPQYRPIFRSSRARKYQQAIDWIRSIYQPRFEYDLGYPPSPENPDPTSLPPEQTDTTPPDNAP